MKYDKDTLRTIDIDSVLSALGLEPIAGSKRFACPYPHKKPHPVTIYSKTNSCKCFNCNEFGGDTIAVVEYVLGVGFKEACEWLHGAFNIPFLDNTAAQTAAPVAKPVKKAKQQQLMQFDPLREYRTIRLRDHFFKYPKMTEAQRLKVVYTYLYRSAHRENKSGLQAYYSKRGIGSHPLLDKLAYIPGKRTKTLGDELLSLFPKEDLVKFGVLKDDEKKGTRFFFDYIDKGGLILIPSFDLYTDMVTGFMVRPTHPPKWMIEKKIKELQLSKREIVSPLPFGMVRETLLADKIYITEGHIDSLSIPYGEVVASPGTYGIDDTVLGLFQGKEIVLVFDQDRSGKKAALGYRTISIEGGDKFEFLEEEENAAYLQMVRKLSAEDTEFDTRTYTGLRKKLLKAGALSVDVTSWDIRLGGDVNEVLVNGNLGKLFGEEDVA